MTGQTGQLRLVTQYLQKINVWTDIVGSRILGPYLFEGTLTGDTYLNFFHNDLVPLLSMLFPNFVDPDVPVNEI